MLRDLGTALQTLTPLKNVADPKAIEQMAQIYIAQGDEGRARTLLFSRFTDTLQHEGFDPRLGQTLFRHLSDTWDMPARDRVREILVGQGALFDESISLHTFSQYATGDITQDVVLIQRTRIQGYDFSQVEMKNYIYQIAELTQKFFTSDPDLQDPEDRYLHISYLQL